MSVILMVQIFWELTSDSAYDNLGYFLRMPSVVANICLQNPYCSSQNKRDIFLVIILKNAAQVVMILLVYFKYSGLNFLSFFFAVCSFCQFSMLRRSCPLDIYLLLPRRLRGSIITFFLTIVFSLQIIFCFAAHRTAYPFTVCQEFTIWGKPSHLCFFITILSISDSMFWYWISINLICVCYLETLACILLSMYSI